MSFFYFPEFVCKVSYSDYTTTSGIFGKKMVYLLSLRARPKPYLCGEMQLLNLVVTVEKGRTTGNISSDEVFNNISSCDVSTSLYSVFQSLRFGYK
jgi:hypothetical protein